MGSRRRLHFFTSNRQVICKFIKQFFRLILPCNKARFNQIAIEITLNFLYIFRTVRIRIPPLRQFVALIRHNVAKSFASLIDFFEIRHVRRNVVSHFIYGVGVVYDCANHALNGVNKKPWTIRIWSEKFSPIITF